MYYMYLMYLTKITHSYPCHAVTYFPVSVCQLLCCFNKLTHVGFQDSGTISINTVTVNGKRTEGVTTALLDGIGRQEPGTISALVVDMGVMPARACIRLTIDAIAMTKAIFSAAARLLLNCTMKDQFQFFPGFRFIVQVALLQFLYKFGGLKATVLSLLAASILWWEVHRKLAAVATSSPGLGPIDTQIFQAMSHMVYVYLVVSIVECLSWCMTERTRPGPSLRRRRTVITRDRVGSSSTFGGGFIFSAFGR